MTPCILWQGPLDDKGYGRYGKTHRYAHRRVMAEIHGWDAIEGKNVNHLCDNPPCVNPDHLYVGTQADNMRDMVDRGRCADARGEKNGRSKLTAQQVREIRARFDVLGTELAAEYGVTPTLISMIRRNKKWRHI